MNDKTPQRMAIAILIDLAQKGEINPWDVDVIRVVDRFLSELGLLESTTQTRATPADLPQSGQAFLWASMLLLLKADTLQQQEELVEPIELESEPIEPIVRLLPQHLEQLLRRRATPPHPPKRRVTLPELIEQIEHIAQEINQQPNTNKRSKRRLRQEAIEAITGLAHSENLTDLAAQLGQFLAGLTSNQCDCGAIDLEQLLIWWRDQSLESTSDFSQDCRGDRLDRVGVFWALLLLASQSKVELSQQQFYQDLTIKPLLNSL